MAGGCQAAGQRPHFDSRATHIKKGVVGLGHMQETHRNKNSGRPSRAPLYAGTLVSSICRLLRTTDKKPGSGLASRLDRQGKSSTNIPMRELYSGELNSQGKHVSSVCQ